MRKIFTYALFFISLIGCDKYELINKTTHEPEIWTFEPTDLDSTGAKFICDIVGFPMSEIDSIGFIFGKHPGLGVSYNTPFKTTPIPLNNDYDTNLITFQSNVDSLLVNGVSYYCQAYVVKNQEIIYGNINYFESKGSIRTNWSYLGEIDDKLIVKSIFNENNNFLLLSNGDIYRFVPKSMDYQKINNSPFNIGDTDYAITCCSDDAIYIIPHVSEGPLAYSDSTNLYKYTINGNGWVKESEAPFVYKTGYLRYHYSFYNDSKLYFIGPEFFYEYDLKNKKWRILNSYPGHTAIGFVNLNDTVFVYLEDKSIYFYNLIDRKWNRLTDFPGRDTFNFDNLVFYGYQNKLYVQYYDEHWQYSIPENKWFRIEPFYEYYFHYSMCDGILSCFSYNHDIRKLNVYQYNP